MPTATQFARFVKLPYGGMWFSHNTASGKGGIRFDIRAANAETMRTIKRYARVGEFIKQALGVVTPEFGAYMRYSVYLEAKRPHISEAIRKNGEYIRIELQRKFGRLVYRYAVSGTSIAQARADVEKAWEGVLNAKPRWWAIKSAQVKFGFHRYTIRGYGRIRSESDIASQQKRLHAEREVMVRAARGNSGERAKIRSRLRRYKVYSGGTHKL